MYYRRKLLLAFLEKMPNQSLGKLNLQKALFLYAQYTNVYFDFIPYQQGCYSFQLNKDLSILSTYYNLIQEKATSWKLLDSQSYFSQLKKEDQYRLNAILKRFDITNDYELITYTYDKFPYFSINSKRELTSIQKHNVENEIKKIKQQDERILFSIGYEGISIDNYLNKLIKNNISLLCDVRKNPISMKYGFSKKVLSNCCENLGIAYLHLPDLGIESSKRENLISKEDYQQLFERYLQELENKQIAISKILDLSNKYNRIALTCFEHSYEYCHRGTLINYLTRNYKIGKVAHL